MSVIENETASEGVARQALESDGTGVATTFYILACIDHKSLEICDQCRLWQQNGPASPDHSAALFEGNYKTDCLPSYV